MAATETYCSELRKAGLNITDQAGDDVDCVLCAYDTELTYEKLVQVCKQLTETKVPGLQQIRICVVRLTSGWYRTVVPSVG